MHKYKMTAISTCFLTLITSTVFAASENSVEFFVSNNTQEITPKAAYDRLIGSEENHLQQAVVDVLQQNHVAQETFDPILGTYQMSSDQHMTGDNTELFSIAYDQTLTNEKIFSISKQLASKLQQESVAVFIPSEQSSIGDVQIKFVSHQPTIDETIKLLHDKLPSSYNQAYSLHLQMPYTDYKTAKVSEIEWLGSKIDPQQLKIAFPLEKMFSNNGTAFLVYKNGKVEQL